MSSNFINSIAPRRNQRLVMPKIPDYLEFYRKADGFESVIPTGSFGTGLMWTVCAFLISFPLLFANNTVALTIGLVAMLYFSYKALNNLFRELKVTIKEGQLIIMDGFFRFSKKRVIQINDIRSVRLSRYRPWYKTSESSKAKVIEIKTEHNEIVFGQYLTTPKREFIYNSLVYHLDKLMHHLG